MGIEDLPVYLFFPKGCGAFFPFFFFPPKGSGASLVAQTVKNPPAMQETGIRSLGREDPLEKGMMTHSIVLAWSIPMDGEPGGL